ncbi:hypothetical protein HO173_009634 [Letharia columbiana]|uniref:Uncharacterized protein n=1 Tax=Letharia columbiana TaxID=112416 RepID=A0A8H6L1S1_9LECA|nr:uncharacterized protein HO173_009634 [Letharia columbiana]KAF6232251.1 hypothetical protein HO173_009634 [Letharia columbiana]
MPKSKNKKEIKDFTAGRPPSTDRLRLLPLEIRLRIYDFASEPLTVHVRRKWKGRETAYSRLLSLPRDKRYIAFRQRHPGKAHEAWPPSIEEALFIALEWTQEILGGIPGLGPMSEIIYEHTGEHRSRKQVSTYLRRLEIGNSYTYDPRSLKLIPGTCSTIVYVRPSERLKRFRRSPMHFSVSQYATSASVGSMLQSLQDIASQLPAAVQADQKFLSLMDQPNPTLNGDVNIFREFTRIVADYVNDFDIYLAAPLPECYFSLLSISRFYRIDALANMASSIVYDFGNELTMLRDFSKLLSPGSHRYIRHVKINMVEAFMLHNETLPFISEPALSKNLEATLPSLRTLTIDLWPRDPARTDKESRAWGEQSEVLIQSLHNVKAKVRLQLRWAADCERFEREYVRNGEWKRVWRDMPGDQSNSNDGICHSCYELHGSSYKEVERCGSEQ